VTSSECPLVVVGPVSETVKRGSRCTSGVEKSVCIIDVIVQSREHGVTVPPMPFRRFIFWWEYGHRMLGRGLGLVYGLPLLYFAARGRIPTPLYPRLALLFGLGGTQVNKTPPDLFSWYSFMRPWGDSGEGDTD
jgi:hypothetical protein